MADGLQVISNGTTPSALAWQKIARRIVIDGSFSYILGLIGAGGVLEGQHFWDTTKSVRYIYDGTHLIVDGGRRIGFSQLGVSSGLTSGNHTMTFSTSVQDTETGTSEPFRASSSGFVVPTWAGGTYTIMFHVVSSTDMSPSGTTIGISRNSGAEFWANAVDSAADRGVVTASQVLSATDTLEFIIQNSGTHTFNYEAVCYWTGP